MSHIKYDGKFYVCFALVTPTTERFETEISGMTLEEAKECLTLLEKEYPFTWTIEGKMVKWERTKPYSYATTTLFGNLVKGVNEHSWFCKNHLKDKSNDPFFIKNFRAWKNSMRISYNWNHYPFPHNCDKGFPLTVKTVKEAMDLLEKENPPKGKIWSTLFTPIYKAKYA